jgi:ankyrin repeat protein
LLINRTPLHYAVKADCVENLRTLLQCADIDPNPKNCDRTPMHDATENGNIQILEVLLADSRVDVNAADRVRHSLVLYVLS